MKSIEEEKRLHSIVEWTVTIVFAVAMIAFIVTMKGYTVITISLVVAISILFYLAKRSLNKWGDRLSSKDKDIN